MAMMEISVVPLGTATPSLSRYVAEIVRVLKAADVGYRQGPMSTIVVGEPEQLFQIARTMHEQPFSLGISRVATTIKIDDCRDKPLTIQGKVQAVQERLRG